MNNFKIRLFNRKDEKDLYPILADESVKRYYRGIYCRTEKEVEKITEIFLCSTNIQVYSIIINKNKITRMIGIIQVEYDEITDKIFLSYVINPKYRNKGIITEAIKNIIKKEIKPYFSGMKLSMYILCENKASIRVAEKIGANLLESNYYEIQL